MEFSLRADRLLFDDPVPFTIEGAVPGTRVEVTVEFIVAGKVLRSSAVFVADGSGSVDPVRVAPAEGSYSVVDGRGLYWSADPVDGWPSRPSIDDVPVRADARRDGVVADSVEYLRVLVGDGVEAADGDDRGIQRLFRPHGAGPFPGVVVFGGSEGGRASADVFAAAFASRGVAALSVAYFGMDGLPAFHQAVPIDDLLRGIEWFSAHDDVRAGGVAVFGTSRGGELALLLGATSPAVNRVIGSVPSGIVWSGMDSTGSTLGSAWSLDGRPVPWLQRQPDSEVNRAAYAQDEVELRPVFEHELACADPPALDRATIPVERTAGPILMFSGREDALWPSTALADIAVARARARGGRYAVEHFAYERAGHACVRVPGTAQPVAAIHPVIGKRMKLGGTRPGNAAATADAWTRIIPFLHETAAG